jgi:hypothetical protein
MENVSGYLIVAAGCLSGIAGHILKKVIQQRESDSTFTLKDFLSKYPYKTAMTVFYAVGGTAGLYFSDAATFYTALTVGFAANSLSGAADK